LLLKEEKVKAILGKKIGMTQVFKEDGTILPLTLVQAGPCIVTGVRTDTKDGYNALQLGFQETNKLKKATLGQFKKSNFTPRYVKEFRSEDENLVDQFKVGDKLLVDQFESGNSVTVSGISKGKGFAGTIKRHNFHRGPKTHGSRSYRRPGSIGSMYPQKIFKGKKMSGRMGSNQTSIHNVNIFSIDSTKNILSVIGPLPGSKNSLIIIKGI
jgi:large subunit ribosomal protein L3